MLLERARHGQSLAVSCLAKAVHGSFSRLQFTPDLLPSDWWARDLQRRRTLVLGAPRRPIFANFVLADGINRAPTKVQSALLEAMQEGHVSIGGETMELPHPSSCWPPKTPIEQEGTYPLPEAQLDRFALKVVVEYPKRDGNS
ncbi:MAG: AAA family ATPase [Planctomycetota bacterium]